MMRVGELSKLTGVSIRSLRHYEQMQVLTVCRADNNYRIYDDTAIGQVHRIRLLLALGFSLRDIQVLAPCLQQRTSTMPLCDMALDRYHRKLTEIDQHIDFLQTLRLSILQQIEAEPS